MKKESALWIVCKCLGLTVLYISYLEIVAILIYSFFTEGQVTVTTNTHGELIPELIFMVTGGILYLVTLLKRPSP